MSQVKDRFRVFLHKLEGQVKRAKVCELAPSISARPRYGVNQSEVHCEAASEGPTMAKRMVGNSTPW